MASLKTLRVLTSEDLPIPSDRDRDYLYFVYDKMLLYLYQSLYSSPFCIVETLPTAPADGMLYISINDGKVYIYQGYSMEHVADIEDPSQIALLKKAGTTYFMNAESRYLDVQTRTVQLPYQNGQYVLSLSLAENLQINEDTFIKYDVETEQFYIAGTEYQPEDKLNNVGKYIGFETDTAISSTKNGVFKVDVKLSENADNMIQLLSDGLFVDTSDLASSAAYAKMVKAFAYYKTTIDRYIEVIEELIHNINAALGNNSLDTRILGVLNSNYNDQVGDIINSYNTLFSKSKDIEHIVHHDMDVAIDQAKSEIEEYINTANKESSTLTKFESTEPEVLSASNPNSIIIETGQNIESGNDGKALILNEFRELVLKDRQNTDIPEDETLNCSGLYDYEQEASDLIMSEFEKTKTNINNTITVYSKEELPENGKENWTYYIKDDTDKVINIYKWIDNQYQEVKF